MECNNTLTHCDLSDLRCGQTYSVSVFAVDESCSSAVSDMAYVKTGMVSTFVSESCQYHCFFCSSLTWKEENLPIVFLKP